MPLTHISHEIKYDDKQCSIMLDDDDDDDGDRIVHDATIDAWKRGWRSRQCHSFARKVQTYRSTILLTMIIIGIIIHLEYSNIHTVESTVTRSFLHTPNTNTHTHLHVEPRVRSIHVWGPPTITRQAKHQPHTMMYIHWYTMLTLPTCCSLLLAPLLPLS